MVMEEWMKLVRTMKSNFRTKDFIPDKDTAVEWFNYFNRYEEADVKAAVTEYILHNSYAPTINDINSLCEKSRSARKLAEQMKHQEKTKYVKCPVCADNGYTMKTYPNGSDECVPCSCEVGRERFKWFFLSKKERTDIMMEEARRGLKPCFTPWTCSDDFKRSYYAGTKGA